MVGVPGRSKACNTCRQRKIACTLERPQCAQCVKSKRICTGYQRERIFVTNHGTVQDSLPPSTVKSLRSTDANPSFASRKKSEVLPLVRSGQSTRTSATCGTALQLPFTKDVSVRHAFRQQLLSEFIDSYFPDSTLLPRRRFGKDKESWFMIVAELPEMTTALEASVLAMSTAKIGRLNNNPVLIKASLNSYVEGLWELQKALWDPKLMYKDETLAACMALWMYEVMECPSETLSGWISHFGGCQRLVELRGPEAHSSALGHQVFLAFRTTAIYQVIKSHQTTYLADSDWTELPWKNVPKTPFDRLLDKTAELANLFVHAFEIEGLESTSLLLAARKVVDRCWKIDTELRRVYQGFESGNPGPLHWPELSTGVSPADDAELGKLFPVAFHFPNLMIAFTCMIYWAASILLWAILMHTYQVPSTLRAHSDDLRDADGSPCPVCSNADSSHHTCNCEDAAKAAQPAKFDVTDLPPIEPRIDVLAAIQNICQSVEYCMQEEMRGIGAVVTVIPLMAVIDVLPNFPHHTRELAWAKAAFKKVNEKGFRLMRYVENAYDTKKPQLQADGDPGS